MSDGQAELNPCGCCEGVTALTPADQVNPPGQPALTYRAGVHGSFKTTMLAQLAQQQGLAGLRSHADDDPAIALIDGWATALDVLTFYQERIANEGYLRTATERGSLLELARTIGYELRPGVAAGTHLAFEMENAIGAPAQATIPVGTRVQSVPGQDEKAQTYETVEEIVAKPQWNRLLLKLTQPQTALINHIYLKTITTQVQPGDALLFVSPTRAVSNKPNAGWMLRKVTDVHLDAANDRTEVWLDPLCAPPTLRLADGPKVYILRLRAALFGHNAPDWKMMSKEIKDAYDPPYQSDTDEDSDNPNDAAESGKAKDPDESSTCCERQEAKKRA